MTNDWHRFPTNLSARPVTRNRTVTPVVLDMDTGVDDAVALVLALISEELDVRAITSVAGNAPVDACTRNNVLISELIDEHCAPPVARGAEAPLLRPLVIAPEVHGEDGLGGLWHSLPDPHSTARIDEPAHEVIARISREALSNRRRVEIGTAGENGGDEPVPRAGDGPVLIATGPLTNLGLALREDPHALDGYERIVIMGGAFDAPGNTGPVAEFNFYVDPDAADLVMGSGRPITLVPLDVTTTTVLPSSMLALYAADRVFPRPGLCLGRILHRALDYYIAFQKWESGLPGGYMHDPLAVATVLHPEYFETTDATVRVLTDGPDRGRSVACSPEPGRTAQVVSSVDAPLFISMLEDRVLIPVFISKDYSGRCTGHI